MNETKQLVGPEPNLQARLEDLEKDLEERARFEAFLAQLSVRFINLPPGGVDNTIEDSQRLFCELLGLDRSTLYQNFDAEPGSLFLTHVYERGGDLETRRRVERRPDANLRSHIYWTPADLNRPETFSRINVREFFPWIYRQLQRGQPIIISSLDELPVEAAQDRDLLRRFGTQSTVVMPMSSGGTTLGCITFASLRAGRSWSETDLVRFRFVADVFANALARKRGDEALRHNEQQLRPVLERWDLLAKATGFGTFDYDFAARRASYSPEHLALHGLPPDGLLELDPDLVPKAIHPDDRLAFLASVQAANDPSGPGLFQLEFRIHRYDNGGLRWLAARGRTLFDTTASGRRPVRAYAIVQDITERKLAEEALCRSYAEIKTLKDRLQAETDHLRAEIKTSHAHNQIIGRSPGLKKVLHSVEQVAAADCAVLVSGETGTGKELIAQEIHRLSARKERLMVLVNCAALPTALVESELFGRERGAYTGALTSQIGRFEVANGSTIFLDEVGELSTEVQAKLLRVLQQGEFQRLGSPKSHHVDVRVIAATNRDLAEEVRKGRFREDLYYRLNVFPIQVPPLRERAEDIPLLVFAFMEELATRMGKKITKIPRKAMEVLQGHGWPGNIRELRNVIEHSVILSAGDTLKLTILGEAPIRMSEPVTLAEAERDHILKTLESTAWRIKGPHGAAMRLDMQPSTLYSRMQKLGIPHRRQKDEMSSPT